MSIVWLGLEDTQYRCSKGHEWKKSVIMPLTINNGKEHVTICPYCLCDFAKANFGMVETVVEPQPEYVADGIVMRKVDYDRNRQEQGT